MSNGKKKCRIHDDVILALVYGWSLYHLLRLFSRYVGCGLWGGVKNRPVFVVEWNSMKPSKQTLPKGKPCECGCGQYPKKLTSRFLPGHDLKKAYKEKTF